MSPRSMLPFAPFKSCSTVIFPSEVVLVPPGFCSTRSCRESVLPVQASLAMANRPPNFRHVHASCRPNRWRAGSNSQHMVFILILHSSRAPMFLVSKGDVHRDNLNDNAQRLLASSVVSHWAEPLLPRKVPEDPAVPQSVPGACGISATEQTFGPVTTSIGRPFPRRGGTVTGMF